MKLGRIKSEPKVSAGSMADIAFLLLIFFLVATNLVRDQGLMNQLPPDVPPSEVEIKTRNLFKILINSNDEFLIEDEPGTIEGLTKDIKEFVLNPMNDPKLSETPQKAIISIKANRGTHYKSFIAALDEVKEAYYQMYGERVGLSSDEFRRLDRDNPRQAELYQLGREGLPMNISIANPEKIL